METLLMETTIERRACVEFGSRKAGEIVGHIAKRTGRLRAVVIWWQSAAGERRTAGWRMAVRYGCSNGMAVRYGRIPTAYPRHIHGIPYTETLWVSVERKTRSTAQRW